MTIMRKIIPFVVALSAIGYAQADDGFSVGGIGDFGGKATSPLTDNGWQDLDQYRLFLPLGYSNTPEDATLANIAADADGGETGQVPGANCASGSYPNLRTTCGTAPATCSSQQKADFEIMRDYNNINPCLVPGYASLTAYKAAKLLGYGLTAGDVSLHTEAAGSGWNAFCASSNCAALQKSQFIIAKSAKTAFQLAAADAASSSQNGTLTWATLTASYGAASVTIPSGWGTAPKSDWLLGYLNVSDHNSSNAMRDAAAPSDWETKVNSATGTPAQIALWYIQQIQKGNYPASDLTASLLTTAGVGSSYASTLIVAQGRLAITDSSKTTVANVASAGSITTWLDGLIIAVWDVAGGTAIAKNDSAVSSSNTAIVTSTASAGGSITMTYSLQGTDAADFAISSAGAVTNASALAGGAYDFTVKATPSVGNAITKDFSLTVNAAPDLGANKTASIGESSASGASVVTAAATDVNGGAISYSLSGANAADFAISSAGVITVSSSASFDYETGPNTRNVTITATDSTSLSDTASLVVTITNVDEAPYVLTSAPSSGSVASDSTDNFATITSGDPENDARTYAIAGSNCNKFTISSSGQIKRKSSAGQGSYSCSVTVSANGKTSTAHAFAVTVTAPFGISCGSNGKWKKFKKTYPQNFSGAVSSSSHKVYGPYGNNNRNLNYMNAVCNAIGSGWRVPTRDELKASSQEAHVKACAPSGENELASSTMNGGVSVYSFGIYNKSGSSSSSNKGDILLCYKP